MAKDEELYRRMPYFALALDPIHVGTGGYRLGRVDLSIVREPGTDLPKVPGTSLTGACRTYSAMTVQDHRKKAGLPPIWPNCAGQGQPDARRNYKGHCGEADCPICVTFGFVRQDRSFQGLAQFSDARLVLFPVRSLAGPVWVTCPDVLRDLDIEESEPPDGKVRVAKGIKVSGRLNLGWLMLAVDSGSPLSLDDSKLAGVSPEILSRTVLVSNKLFCQIVNDNLEVRTSVSIDPATGAAAERALFTYEAIPRATVLAFDVVITDPKFYRIDGEIPLNGEMDKVRETVEEGLKLFEVLGIGGMGTRGMGRIRILNLSASSKGGRL